MREILEFLTQVALLRVLSHIVYLAIDASRFALNRANLVLDSPECRVFDVAVHHRRSGAHHPAVFGATAHHSAHFGSLVACPDVHKVGFADIAHRFLPIFTFQTIARINFAVGVDKEVHRTRFARQRATAAVDVIDESHIEKRAEPALGVILTELPVDERFEVGAHLLAIGDSVVVLVEIIGIVECRSGKFHTQRL